MKRFLVACVLMSCVLGARAAEFFLPLDEFKVDQAPPDFKPMMARGDVPGEWKVILDDVPPLLPPLSPQARVATKRPVIAQLSADPTDERFPLLVYDLHDYGDFKLSCRVKTVGGKVERMAGIVFRLQDEKNFYVLRISSLGQNIRWYKVVAGERGQLIGTDMKIPSGEWHELTIECKGNEIRCGIDGKEAMPPLQDNSFLFGKIGFFTKSDSVCYFTDLKLDYVPRVPLAQMLVDDMMKEYDRLVSLRVYTTVPDKKGLYVVASNQKEEIGQEAIEGYMDIWNGRAYSYGRNKDTFTIALPLRDRNGDIVGVVRAVMDRFPGQTENNALARSLPVIKLMEQRVRSRRDLTQ